MADNILDRKKHPLWQGERTKLVYAFPTNETPLGELCRAPAPRVFGTTATAVQATDFYRQNREAMDEGAVVAWPERHHEDELSAVQHAMNLRFRDEAAFFAEYQNEPILEEIGDGDLVTAEQVAEKINHLGCGELPVGCEHVTMFVDVQANLLFYVVAGWEEDFTGYILDYGSYPDQHRPYFTLRDARRTLSLAAPGTGLEGAIHAGLDRLTKEYLAREWKRDDGALMRIDRCLVDANWGQSTDIVYQFCRQSPHSNVIMPSHGRFIGASSKPFSEYQQHPGERLGLNWRIPSLQARRTIRHVVYDTNYWKSFVCARFLVPMGQRGCLSLFGNRPEHHRLFAEHLTAEYRVKTEGRGRVVDEWKLRPGSPDNHWLDGLVGCAVAASMQGVALSGMQKYQAVSQRKRMTMAELAAQARHYHRQ